MGWSYRIVEIRKPSFVQIAVCFDVLQNGELRQRDEIILDPNSLASLTIDQKSDLIKSQILQRLQSYATAGSEVDELSVLLNSEVAIGGDRAIIAKELADSRYDGMDSAQKLEALNARSILSDPPKAPLWEIKQRLLLTGEWWGLVAGQSSGDVQIATICKSAVAFIDDPKFENLQVDLPGVPDMLGALQLAGLMSADTGAAIQALTYTSRARQLLGRDATANDLV